MLKGRGALQDIDHVTLMRSLVKICLSPTTVAEVRAQLFITARERYSQILVRALVGLRDHASSLPLIPKKQTPSARTTPDLQKRVKPLSH